MLVNRLSPIEIHFNSILYLIRHITPALYDEIRDKYTDNMQKLIDRMHDTMYNVLRPEHKDCVCEYYGLNERGRRMSMIKIGAERGISRQRVHKIISESLSALVSPIEMLLND